MSTKNLTKHYDRLTPEERFRLVMAAAARGDEAERERLESSSAPHRLVMGQHGPYVDAFTTFARLYFMELVDHATSYLEAFDRADYLEELQMRAMREDAENGSESDMDWDAIEKPASERCVRLALGMGFMLKTKANGWKLFCERLSIPPFLVWEELPGYERLQRALKMAEGAAFVPEGFLKWLNEIRPAGEPEVTELKLTVEGIADSIERAFRKGVTYSGG